MPRLIGLKSRSTVSSLSPKSRLMASKQIINLLPGPLCAQGTFSKASPKRWVRRSFSFRSMDVEPHLPPYSPSMLELIAICNQRLKRLTDADAKLFEFNRGSTFVIV